MNTKQKAIYTLIQSIIDYLQDHRDQSVGVPLILEKLKAMDLHEREMNNLPACVSRHEEVLDRAIEEITNPSLANIANCISGAKDHLAWQEDNGKYYASGAQLGDGYRQCNLHSLLIGPGACGFEDADFNLGLFMLGPRVLYRDHRHAAPELYLNLSDRSGWRKHGNDWQDYVAGSFIWNPAWDVHATKVYERPFISVFVWLNDINELCEVVYNSDWDEIENSLISLS